MPVSAPSASAALGGFTDEAFAAHLAAQSAAPRWWLDRKRAAYEKFAALPLPVRTDEAWRFSSLKGLALDGFAPAPDAGNAASDVPASTFKAAATLRFVNNRLCVSATAECRVPLLPERATSGPLGDHDLRSKGVIVTSISEALRRHEDLLKAHFMVQPPRLGSDKFAALHAAFVNDGAFIHIPKGVELAEPIVVIHAVSGEGAAVFPHTLVIAEERAKASIIDWFVPAGGFEGRCFAVGANDLYAGHGSQLTYAAVQSWPRQALSFQLNSTIVRRDARMQTLNVHLGAAQARHESLSELQAPGGSSEMLALTVATADQEFDQRTLQIHQAPNTKSDLLYKNALFGKARTIFSGLIVVDPDAQKTDAYQSNRNLLLSEDAEANSLPGLEIQANDVRCTHGATSSRIDPEQQFYLQSRGISPAAAHELLVAAFFEDVLGRVDNPPLHNDLARLIRTKLEAS